MRTILALLCMAGVALAQVPLEKQIEQSSARAVAAYPDAGLERTALFAAVTRAVREKQQTDSDFFQNPTWPESLVAAEAKKLGIKPQSLIRLPENTAQPVAESQPSLSREQSEAARLGLGEEEYIALGTVLRVASGEKGSITLEENDHLNLGITLGIIRQSGGYDRVELAYWRALYNGASIEEANAIKQTALQEKAIALQQQASEEQTWQLQQLRQEVNALRNEVPQNQVKHTQMR